MSTSVEEQFNPDSLRATLYGEAFSEASQKNGRTLLVVATLTLITTVFDVDVKSTPLLPLDFSNHPESLLIFLAISNVALLVSYCIRAGSDLVRAAEEWAEAKKQIEIERIRRALESARDVDRAISEAEPSDRYDPVIDDWWESYQEAANSGIEKIRALEARIARRRIPIAMRWSRLVFFGGLPLVAAVLALAHTWREVIEFVRAILGTPIAT
jgi:hypothetical protein